MRPAWVAHSSQMQPDIPEISIDTSLRGRPQNEHLS